ncbi:hypothetical protein EDC04DRAFT_2516558, partial [Pisolithus marmoratus]
ELTDDQWEVLEQLHDVLKVLKDATTFFLQSTPNLATIIPAMGCINKEFVMYLCNTKHLQSICTAISLATKTLNHYYSLTDSSEVYHITMVLHPQHKLSYFKAAHWPDDWIKT